VNDQWLFVLRLRHGFLAGATITIDPAAFILAPWLASTSGLALALALAFALIGAA